MAEEYIEQVPKQSDLPQVESQEVDNDSDQPDPKKKLWKGLSDKKMYTKSYEDFQKQFSNQESIDKLYKGLSDKKMYTKENNDFYNQFFPDVKKKETTVEPSKTGMQTDQSGIPTVSLSPSPSQKTSQPSEPQNQIKGIKDFGIDLKDFYSSQKSDKTYIPKPVDLVEQKRLSELHKQKVQKAIDNTTAKALRLKGIKADANSPAYIEQKKKVQQAVDNGDATYQMGKDGEPGLNRTIGFWDSLTKGWNESINGNKEADDFVNNMTTEQRVEFANRKQKERPEDEYIGELPGALGSAGQLIGENASFLGKAALGTAAGAGLVMAAPETAGASLEGLPAVVAFAATAPDMVYQGGMQETLRRYNILKKENPEKSEEELMSQAEEGMKVGEAAGGITNMLLMGTAGNNPISKEGKDVVGSFVSNALKSATHMGTVSAGVEAGKEGIGAAQGIKTTPSEVIENTINSFKDNATVGLALHGVISAVTGLTKVPKAVNSAFKYALKDQNPVEIQNILQANEQQGKIPPGTSQAVMTDLANYNEALGKTTDGLTPEAQASVAGLMQKRNDLQKEMSTKDFTQLQSYQDRIDALNKQIEGITKTNNPFAFEVDDVTGKPLDGNISEAPVLKENNVGEHIEVSPLPEQKKEGEQAYRVDYRDEQGNPAHKYFNNEEESKVFFQEQPTPPTGVEGYYEKLPKGESVEIIKTQKNDKENIAGVPSEVGVGEEPIQAQPIEGGGAQEISGSGVLQTQGAEGEGKGVEQKVGEEIRKRGLDRLFPIEIDETTPEGKQLAKEKKEQEDKIKQLESEFSKQAEVGKEALKKMSDADIENRLTEIQNIKNPTRIENKEFDILEKEMENRERNSVFNVTLDKVNDAVDALMQKEKDMPNGWGAFIEKRDARETKEIANKYLNAKELTDNELKEDFKNAIWGNPATWYADGLKLRESMKEAANRGIDIQEMIKEIEKEFIKDGYTAEDAHFLVARKLKPIFEGAIEAKPELPSIEAELPKQEGVEKVGEKKTFSIDDKEDFYHGSYNKREGKLRTNTAEQFGDAIYFTTSKEEAEGNYPNVTKVKLNIENPIYAGEGNWSEVQKLALEKENANKERNEDGKIIGEVFDLADIKNSKNISDAAKELGYDAIILRGEGNHENETAVLDPSKIIYPEDIAKAELPKQKEEVKVEAPKEEVKAEAPKHNKDNQPEFTTATGRQKVNRVGDELVVTDTKTGEPVSRKTHNKAVDEYVNNFDFTHGEEGEAQSMEPKKAVEEIVESSNNPSQLATLYAEQDVPFEVKDMTKDDMIADYGLGGISKDSYRRFGDINKLSRKMLSNYIAKKGEASTTIDSMAKSISDHYFPDGDGTEITPQDLVDFMENYESKKQLMDKKNPLLSSISDKFQKLTGIKLTREVARKAINQQIEKVSQEEQNVLNQDYESAKQLEDNYWRDYKATDGFAKEAPTTETPQAREEVKGTEKPTGSEPGAAEGGKPPVPPTTEPTRETAKPSEPGYTGIRKEKLKEIEGVKEMFDKRVPKKWNETYDSAFKNLSKMHPKKSPYEAMKARVDELNLRMNNGELYNPTSEDIAVFTVFKAETEKRLNQIEGLDSPDDITRQMAILEGDALKQDLRTLANVAGTTEAGRAFNMRQSEAKMDENYGLKIRRMELMKAKGGEKLSEADMKWTEEQWNKEKELLKQENDLKIQSLQENFDAKIAEIEKQYKEKASKSADKTIKGKTLSQKGKDVADKIRKLKTQKGTLSSDITLGFKDLAIEAVAQLVEKGSTVAEAIQDVLKDAKFKSIKEDELTAEIFDLLNKKDKSEELDRIKKFAEENGITDITSDMVKRNMIRDYIDSHVGEIGADKMLETALKDLKSVLPNATKEGLLEAYLKKGDFKPETKSKIITSIKEQQAQFKKIAKEELTADQEQKIALAAEKERIKNRIKEYERKIKEGEFEEEKPVKLTKADAELIKLKKQQSIIEEEYNKKEKEYKDKNRGKVERTLDFLRNVWVTWLIKSPLTTAKVGIMSALRIGTEFGTKSTAGKVFDLFFKGISKAALKGGESTSWEARKKLIQASIMQYSPKKLEKMYDVAEQEYKKAAERYDNYKSNPSASEKTLQELKNDMNNKLIKAQGNFLYKFIGGSSIKDAVSSFVNRSNEIEKQFGHTAVEKFKEGDALDKTNYVLGFIGRSHSALKTFSGRASFASGFMSRLEGAIEAGEDISSPDKIIEIANESYLDFSRGKYQQDNAITYNWNKMVNAAKGGKYEGVGKAMEFIAKGDVAITRVPVNVLHEAVMEYTLGAFTSLAKAIKVDAETRKQLKEEGFTNGEKIIDDIATGTNKEEFKNALRERISQMDPDQAAQIVRCFRKGLIGAGLYSFALISGAVQFGILPHKGQKKKKEEEDLKPGELNPGDIIVGNTKLGENVSKIAEHIPMFYPTFMGLGLAKAYKDEIDKGKTTREAAAKSIMTHLKIVESGIPQTKIISPLSLGETIWQSAKKTLKEQGVISDKKEGDFTEEELTTPEFKTLEEKGVKIPSIGDRGSYKIKRDANDGSGIMTEEQFNEFVPKVKEYIQNGWEKENGKTVGGIKDILETQYDANTYDDEHILTESDVILGKDLPKDVLKEKLQGLKTQAANKALEDMGLLKKAKTTYKKQE